MPGRNAGVPVLVVLVLLGLAPILILSVHEPFFIDLLNRIMIFGIAAISLDLIMGLGNMPSLGHAAYLGIGSYAVGIWSFYGVDNGWVQFGTAILGGGLVALLVGLVALRTTGAHFIMITLGFGQMFYYLGVSLQVYGGDDGLPISQPSQFGSWIDLGAPVQLYYVVLVILAMLLVGGLRLVSSRFGRVVVGTRINDRRMRTLGFPTFRYRLAAFVLAGAICSLAGALLANQALFATPEIMDFTRSGELMLMVVIGGAATLLGPLLGAALFLTLEDRLSSLTGHWQIIFGAVLLVMVLVARRGIYGLLVRRPRHA